MIKFTKLIFAFSLLLLLNSCGKDDATNSADLVGTWTAETFTADIGSTTDINGVQTIVSNEISASNLTYELTFTDAAFTTSGGYNMTVVSTVNGDVASNKTDTYSDIDGSGTYSVDGNKMTVKGSFFDFEFNGMSISGTGEEQTVDFEINSDGKLVFDQDEQMTTTTNGITTTSDVKSKSVWVKK